VILGGALFGWGCGAGESMLGHEDAAVTLSLEGGAALQQRAGDVPRGALVEGEKPPATIVSVAPNDCLDEDGDGYGFGNTCRGPDCDDADPAQTDGCYRCREPLRGCPCEADSGPVPCDVVTGRNANPEGVCQLGQRRCVDGQWGVCEAWRQPFQYQGPVSACPGSCLPGCRQQVLCPAPGDVLPGGSSGVRIGGATQAVFCPTGTPRGGVTAQCHVESGDAYTRGPSPLAFQSICSSPGATVWLPNADDGTFGLTLPFAFDFYGAPYTRVEVSANGMLSFGPAVTQFFNYALPYLHAPNTVFAFWDDLHTRAGGICTLVRGTAPTRQVVVQWRNARFYGADDPSVSLNFQVVLTETRNTLDVLYGTMTGEGSRASGSSATLGIQQGSGTRYDQVGYNLAGTVSTGSTIRWSPANGRTRCEAAVYRRVFDGDCNNGDAPRWGQFNYTAVVPAGTRIGLEARFADREDQFAAATPVRLPDAPPGTTGQPVSLDLGATVRAQFPGAVLDGRRFLQITATLIPSDDGAEAPTLVSTQTQFVCHPADPFALCREGVDCYLPTPCRRGVITCSHSGGGRPVERCVEAGIATPGTVCGDGRVCNSNGACTVCNEGASCDLGTVCAAGRITCASGEARCVAGSFATAGSVCRGDANSYRRAASPLAYVDACALPGHVRLLADADDAGAAVPLPFPFVFYGVPRSTAWVGSNGTLSFSADAQPWRYVNGPLPAVDMPDSVFAFWDDLALRDPGVCVAALNTAPSRQLVFTWRDAHFVGPDVPDTRLNFSLVLTETSHTLDLLYGTMTGDGDRATGSSATVGLQRDRGSLSDLVGFDTAGTVTPNTGLRWTPTIQAVCDGAGACVTCDPGTACDTGDPCAVGNILCTGAVPACVRVGTRPPGTTCGAGRVCDPAGVCIPCAQGAACPASQPCGEARISCDTGAPVCRDVQPPAQIECNGVCVAPAVYYRDTDGDTWGRNDDTQRGCPGVVPAGYVTRGGDCDDANPAIHPAAVEVCDGRDNDCDGLVDNIAPTSCIANACQSGHRACGATGEVCVPTTNINEGQSCGGTPGALCRAGQCTCDPTTELVCGGACTNVVTNAQHCGACGNACLPGHNCILGSCVGSGALQFALTWDRNNDVDLHVRPPCGTEIFYGRLNACGGFLDRDDIQYRGPENIYWESETYVTNGWYEVCATPYQLHGGPTTFTLQVFRNGARVAVRTGTRSTSSGNRACSYGSTDWVMSYNPITGAFR
jgi:hypothetical protein